MPIPSGEPEGIPAAFQPTVNIFYIYGTDIPLLIKKFFFRADGDREKTGLHPAVEDPKTETKGDAEGSSSAEHEAAAKPHMRETAEFTPERPNS